MKKIKDGIAVIMDASVETIKNPLGTARIVSGFSTLKSGADAGVTPAQFRAMFSDLRDYSDEKISGFVELGSALADGSVVIPSSIIQGPVGAIEPEK
ncbi:hypothetical protein MKT11_007990 [Providencia rettgeri]|uniref:hypothetical protein n=1 Tax=Providencia sp. PROV035 TaxID=2949766 RepID=UPI00234A7335|nr:hypothetical protein [Providencia sp. PROV035]MCL0019006.1 hypothetical protein [Providencia rettgeri]